MEIQDNIETKILYQRLLTDNGRLKTSSIKESPIDIKPEPEDEDYEVEFMYRFFAVKSSDPKSTVFEIDREQYNRLLKNPFYEVQEIKWKIAGPLRDTYDENGVKIKIGVIENNERVFKSIRKIIPDIGFKIRSLTEFYSAEVL